MSNSIEISNIPEKQKRLNKKVFLGILLGIILLVAISIWWLK
jgi:cell division protein FtsL